MPLSPILHRAVSASKPLAPEEAARLVAAAKKGDGEASAALVACLYRFLAKRACKWRENERFGHDDLFAAGAEAAFRAINRFDPSRGSGWFSYASSVAAWSMRDFAVRHTRRIRIPDGKPELEFLSLDAENGAADALSERPDRSASPSESAEAGIGIAAAVAALDSPVLSPRERDVLARRFGIAPRGEPKTFAEVGRELGLSREGTRQIADRAMRRLREAVAW